MKYLFSFLLGSLIFITSCKKHDTSEEDTYTLVWSDEFNYTGLPDSTYWSYEEGALRSQSAYYQNARLENSKVDNGLLTITALNDSISTGPISSASVITKGKVDFKYGKLEVRAKMPSAKGTWPAIWTLGTNREVVGWPTCGEIDIVECLGNLPQYVFGSIHKANTEGTDNYITTPYLATTDLYTDFHTYAIVWSETELKFYFDDVNYVTYTSDQMPAAEWEAFQKTHYLLLNLAVGGTYSGTIDYTAFPMTYQIDYVRYYKKDE
ncbi:MAG: glycoside hydrolase family 16 protein [Siphonobacter sp.]